MCPWAMVCCNLWGCELCDSRPTWSSPALLANWGLVQYPSRSKYSINTSWTFWTNGHHTTNSLPMRKTFHIIEFNNTRYPFQILTHILTTINHYVNLCCAPHFTVTWIQRWGPLTTRGSPDMRYLWAGWLLRLHPGHVLTSCLRDSATTVSGAQWRNTHFCM